MPRLHPPLAITAVLLAWGLAPSSLAPGWSGRVREAMQAEHRNSGDLERMERGYYEVLTRSDRGLDLITATKSDPPPTDFGPLTLPVADVREYVLKPGLSTRHRGATWTTNARGMRDRDYPTRKPEGTYRIALAGDSIGAGWGVDDGQGFEPTWERALSRSSMVEIWNHAVPGLAPGQRWDHFTREGWASNPDLVVFQGTPADFGWDDRKLRSLLPKGIGWEVPSYKESLAIAHARPGGDEESYKKTLRPLREAILAGVYRTVAIDCRSKRIASVWLLLPRVGKATPTLERKRLVDLARGAGFTHIVDLSDAFDGLDPAALAIGPHDFHPNASGHEILARRLDDALREHLNLGGDPR
jgi:GDSL-like Lipase/Acylhydrolase family